MLNTEKALRFKADTVSKYVPHASHIPPGTNLAVGKAKANKIKSSPLKSFHFSGRDKGEHLNNITHHDRNNERDTQQTKSRK